MKHGILLKICLAALLLVLPMQCLAVFKAGSLYYSVGSEATVTRDYEYDDDGDIHYIDYNLSGDIVIPSSIQYNGQTVPVTGIEEGTFRNCTGITSVTIPASIKYIRDEAFMGCTSLQNITFNGTSNIQYFGSGVFDNTKWLYDQPNGMTYLANKEIAYKYKGSVSAQDEHFVFGLSTRVIAGSCFANKGIKSVDFCVVKVIGNNAFLFCTGLKYADMYSIERISANAFSHCSQLTEVTMGNNINYIAGEVFVSTPKLQSVFIRASSMPYFGTVTYWGYPDDSDAGPFFNAGGTGGVALYVPSALLPTYQANGTLNGDYAYNCTLNFKELVEVVRIKLTAEKTNILVGEQMPITVTYIPSNASLKRCTWSSSYNATVDEEGVVTGLSAGIASIKAYPACGSCSSDESTISIQVSNPSVTVGDYVYDIDQANGVAGVKANVSSITSLAFCDTIEYDGVQYPVKKIVDSGFKDCTSITELVIPDGITTIGSGAFSRCRFTKAVVPASVTVIGQQAFFNCTSLKEVVFEDGDEDILLGNSKYSDGIGGGLFEYCPIETAYIGRNINVSNYHDSYNRPYSNAPFSCWYANTYTPMKTATIAANVTKLCDYFFERCNAVETLTCYVSDPSQIVLGQKVFRHIPKSTCVLQVPAGSMAAYQAAEQWQEFTNIVEMEPPTILASSVSLDESNVSLTEGMALQLTATVLPEDATDKSVTWTCSDGTVATVDENGLVTAVAAGTATITATTNDGSALAATCQVTVEASAANQLMVENYTVLRGHSLTLPVQLANTANNLTALQADIHLPEGIGIEMDGDEYVIDLVSDRVARDHTLSSNRLASGAVRVLIASPTKKLFTGNSGDLFTISLLTSDEMSAGDYALTIDNIILSDNEVTTYHAPDVTSTIKVLDVEMGDATGDGQINVGDYVATAGYILEEDPQPFVFVAADIDANGTIDVGDLVGVAGIILSTESPAGMPARQAAASGTANLGVKCNRTGDGNYLLSIDMSNDASVTAMQMDLMLPEGLRLADASLTDRASGSHAVDFNRLHNGDWRVLAASGSNKAFRDTEGAVLTLELEGDGEGNCSIENIMLAQPNGTRIVHDNLNFEFGLVTGVNDVYSKVNIYAQGDMLIVESPHDTVAQLVMPNGTSRSLHVSAGRNVYRLGHVGYVFVKVDNQVAKFRF